MKFLERLNTYLVVAAVADVVDRDDSEDADSDSGEPARRTFLRFRGLPFSFGAVEMYTDCNYTRTTTAWKY